MVLSYIHNSFCILLSLEKFIYYPRSGNGTENVPLWHFSGTLDTRLAKNSVTLLIMQSFGASSVKKINGFYVIRMVKIHYILCLKFLCGFKLLVRRNENVIRFVNACSYDFSWWLVDCRMPFKEILEIHAVRWSPTHIR